VVRAPILGTILNGIDLKNPDYAYYRKYYGSNYGVLAENGNRASNGKSDDVIAESESAEGRLSSFKPGAETVSKEFLDKMVSELSKAMGPRAPQIVNERAALLGESLDTFPTSRLKELLEKVCEGIRDEKLSQRFQDAMALEIIRSP